ncbi:GNAT family N-acetyltransferase [Aquimarina algiphila]|uniref:GNAT family N-acetyltransferase n=1 Tax=Aquimarina algiphila TaxID=2047982 RepID=UPI00232D7495|nr:GNAT family N-acetyltransferase [Aquimarina algiphila]
MQLKYILETERLSLREFEIEDANFIIELLNTPNWLEFIGDIGVKTTKDARNYMKNGPLASYKKNGFGLWLVQLKASHIPIGMCGLVNRDTLEHVDIGFALLPEYEGLGYGFEIANATMNYAKHSLNIESVIAVTDSENTSSIKLLQKIGLNFEKTLKLSEDDSVLVFAPTDNNKDRKEINNLAKTFFDLFTNANGKVPDVKMVLDLFIPSGRIINNTNEYPEIYSLEEFIIPREQLLNGGILTDFIEYEISSKTEIYKNIANRFSLYEKSGRRNGIHFESKGMKSMQFIKVNNLWKIVSIVWNDEK